MVSDLGSDQDELYNVFADRMDMGWMLGIALKFVADYQKSIAEYPDIKTGEEFEGYPVTTLRPTAGSPSSSRRGIGSVSRIVGDGLGVAGGRAGGGAVAGAGQDL
jgi:hypothetical protein